MDKKIVAIILIIIAVVIGGAYYTSHSDDNIMTIGYLPSDHDAALFVANSQGEFAKHGVHIKLVQFNNGGDLMTAMASGDVEVGYVGITPVLSSIEKGVPVKVISAAQSEGSAIVVSPNSGIVILRLFASFFVPRIVVDKSKNTRLIAIPKQSANTA